MRERRIVCTRTYHAITVCLFEYQFDIYSCASNNVKKTNTLRKTLSLISPKNFCTAADANPFCALSTQ